MNRPIFLTRRQRWAIAARRSLGAIVVFGLFIGIGLAIGVSL